MAEASKTKDEKKTPDIDREALEEYALQPKEKPAKGRKLRIFLWCLAGLLALLVAVFIFRDPLIEAGVRSVGSLVTGPRVEIASFKSTLAGTVELKGIKVANPAGYQKPHIFEVARICVKLQPSTLLSDEPVVETVEVSGVRVDMEIKGPQKSNLTDLQKNVEKFAGSASENADDNGKENDSAADGPAPLIKSIALTDMQVSFSSSAINSSVPVPLAPIYLKNVGGKGHPLGETLMSVFSTFVNAVNALGGTVIGSVEFVGDTGKKIGQGVTDGAKSIGGALDGLLKKTINK